MRLLVLDEAWQLTGGVDSFRRSLLPLLAARVEKLWWASPSLVAAHRLAPFDPPGVEILDTFPPTLSAGGLALAALRRLPADAGEGPRALAQRFWSRRHLRQLCRELGVTHIFEVAVFREPFPRFGLPTVGIVHDLDYPDRGSSPLDRIFREWLDSAAWLFTNSSQTRAELLELAPEAAERVEVMLHPPAAPPSPLLRREDSPWRRPEPVLYYPASAIPRKGHDVLLSALSALAARGVPFHCYLSGRGTETLWSEQTSDDEKAEAVRRACQPWRHSLRDRVTPLGAREWAEVEQLYAAADLVVLPTRYEGYGLPLGEALRRERPVVASQLPSFEEQINFLDAAPLVRLTPPGDATALADTLVEALGGAQPFPEFSPELRSRLAVWTWEAFADRVVAALAAAGAPAA